jgi:integration host factor subunit alpha
VNKKHVVQAIHDKVGFSKRETSAIVDKTIELVKSSLAAEDPVLISSFGKFDIREKKAHKGRNPQTGEAITIPARKVVTFRASRVLKERINAAHRNRNTG